MNSHGGELWRRIETLFETGDEAGLLAPEAGAIAAGLLSGDHRDDQGVLVLTGLFHWYRGHFLPQDEAGAELDQALTLLERLPAEQRAPLPEPVAAIDSILKQSAPEGLPRG